MSKFSRLERYSNWCYIDRLDGKDLKNKEEVTIRFPDGTEEVHSLIVKRSSETVDDMGRPWTIPISEAGIEIEYRGLKAWVRLPKGTYMRRQT